MIFWKLYIMKVRNNYFEHFHKRNEIDSQPRTTEVHLEIKVEIIVLWIVLKDDVTELSKMLWNTPPAINNPSNFKWSKGIDPLSQRALHILIQHLHWQLISNAFGWPKITCRENGRKGLETNHSQRIQALEMFAFFKSIKEHLLKTLHPLHFLHLKRFCYCYQMEPYCLTFF